VCDPYPLHHATLPHGHRGVSNLLFKKGKNVKLTVSIFDKYTSGEHILVIKIIVIL
jgi:hypothetical protein